MNSNHNLPDELKLMIAPSLVPDVCKIRRHIAIRLLQHQRLTTTRIPPPPGIDLDFQSLARRLMDHTESNQFRGWMQRSIGPCLADTAFFEIVRDVERDWLREMPMDYREFYHFCHHSGDDQYKWRTKIVIELFPSADFSNPPQQLSNTNLFSQPVTTAERNMLANRQHWSVSGNRPQDAKQLDRRIYQGLSKIWLQLIRNSGLPHFVRHVWVISKDNDRPNPACRAREVDGRALGNITGALKHQVGDDNVVMVF